jgi:hypothetical protein
MRIRYDLCKKFANMCIMDNDPVNHLVLRKYGKITYHNLNEVANKFQLSVISLKPKIRCSFKAVMHQFF